MKKGSLAEEQIVKILAQKNAAEEEAFVLKIRIWIIAILCALLGTMGVGARTRLADAGLSIVHWKPISGIIPPLNETQWVTEFKSYQQYPDYKSRPTMDMKEFKTIFWWEFVHRLMGRLIGLVILIPYAWLWLRKELTPRHHRKVFLLLILGGIQGALGWFMVKSGLAQTPRVSHLRLMTHLLWACLIIGYLAHWLREESFTPENRRQKTYNVISWICFLQIGLGALVAGTRAGYIYNTFPKMGDTWFPSPFFAYPTWLENLFYNQINLQFFHRVGGVILLAVGVYTLAIRDLAVGVLILTQFILGLLTLVLKVPPTLAVLHQITGITLFFLLRYRAHRPSAKGTSVNETTQKLIWISFFKNIRRYI